MQYYFYSIYNLSIKSFFPFPELSKSSTPPDVVIKKAMIRPPRQALKQGERLQVTPESIYLYYQDYCSLRIKKKEIAVDIDENADEEDIKQYILGPALAVLLHLHGYLVLHGSSIGSEDHAFAFLGHSGIGKSTITAMMYSLGYQFISDDYVVLKKNKDRWVVMPGVPVSKLWPEALDLLGEKAVNYSKVHSKIEKRKKSINKKLVKKPMPLKKVYILDDSVNLSAVCRPAGARNTITPFISQAKVPQLVKHTFVANLLYNKTMRVHFLQCADLAKQVPVLHLQRVSSLELLPELIHLIDEDIGASVLA